MAAQKASHSRSPISRLRVTRPRRGQVEATIQHVQMEQLAM
jgi:hypothetical protein